MIIIVIIARVPPSRSGMPLASDADPFHHRQKHDQDGGCGDAHVGDVEDRPVRQLQKVDHVTAQHSGRSEQPIGQVSGDASTQEPDRHSPGWMTDSRDQLDDHEGKHQDAGDRKHISKTLALAEGSARVPNKPQREQSTEQADGGKRLELSYRDDLGDKISCQPGNGDKSDEKAQASSLDRVSAAG
jgi:hypothetical protein